MTLIIPFDHKEESATPVDEAIRALKKLRKGISLRKKLKTRELREQGRKRRNSSYYS